MNLTSYWYLQINLIDQDQWVGSPHNSYKIEEDNPYGPINNPIK